MSSAPRVYLDDVLAFTRQASSLKEVEIYLKEVIANLPSWDNTLTMADIQEAEKILIGEGRVVTHRAIGEILGYSAPRVSQVKNAAKAKETCAPCK